MKYAISVVIVGIIWFADYIDCNDTSYTFFVAGHVYGHHASRLANADKLGFYPLFAEKIRSDIKELHIDFGVLTGDIVYRSTPSEWDAIDADIESLGIPIHMVPGNHDVANRKLFTSRYAKDAKTYHTFNIGNDLFILLDGSLNNWSIEGEQLEFLKTTLNNAHDYKNIFLFVHQILWWESDNEYSLISVNSLAGRGETVNFWSEIEPLFNQLPNSIYMFAGDTGVAKNAIPSYNQYDNIHLITSGMGGGVNDNYMSVTVSSNKNVEVEVVWLNSGKQNAIMVIQGYYNKDIF